MSAVIDGFVFDVFVREEPTLTNEVTKYPVEEGSDHSDHIITRPLSINIEGIVSDTPLGIPNLSRSEDSLPSNDAYAHLSKIMSEKRLVTVTTSKRKYTNMALTTLSDPRDANTGDALLFRATFMQVLTVSVALETKTTLVELPREQKKKRKRSKPPKKVEEPPKPKVENEPGSILYNYYK